MAESGAGGKESTVGICDQIGPYTGSTTGARILKVNGSGKVTTVADNIPSSILESGEVSGVGDVAFVGHHLYGLLSGAGCTMEWHQFPMALLRSIQTRPGK